MAIKAEVEAIPPDIMAQSFSVDLNVISLNVCHKRVGNEGMKKLCLLPRLNTLKADNNNIGDEGIKSLADNTSITHLNLALNRFTSASCGYLAENRSIKELNVSCNGLMDKGLKTLSLSKTIERLHVHLCASYDEGIVALATSCPSLRTLALTELKSPMDTAILQRLNIEDTMAGQLSKAAMEALVNSTSITELRMEGYKEIVVPIVSTSRNLKRLSIFMQFDEELARAALTCTSLTDLDAVDINAGAVHLMAQHQGLERICAKKATVCPEGAAALEASSNFAYFGVTWRLFVSPAALEALSESTVLMEGGDCYHDRRALSKIKAGDLHKLNNRIAENKQRAQESSRIFVMAIEMAFSLKAAMRKRLRSIRQLTQA